MKKKKTAWYVEPSLLDLLKRRDETLANWMAAHKVTDEASLRLACNKMSVTAPPWEQARLELRVVSEPAKASYAEAPTEARSVPAIMNAWNSSRKKKKREEAEMTAASPEESSDADS